jgi:hypothetical protein
MYNSLTDTCFLKFESEGIQTAVDVLKVDGSLKHNILYAYL